MVAVVSKTTAHEPASRSHEGEAPVAPRRPQVPLKLVVGHHGVLLGQGLMAVREGIREDRPRGIPAADILRRGGIVNRQRPGNTILEAVDAADRAWVRPEPCELPAPVRGVVL